ncbi:MAG TPA: hypothetical protein VHC69_30225 [Polyangiaceae bacterium]|nr:hypothetical protein [Polyangiaceae bacterium]
MASAATSPISDPDVWWVAAAGREMGSSGTVPRVNLFSYVEPLHPWIMHEWLLGPIYAAGLSRLGPSFFTLVAIATLATGSWLVLSLTVGRARRERVGYAAALVCLACFSSRLLTARPTGVALLLPLAMALVAFRPRFSRRAILTAVLVEAAWTNVHGSFPLGVALLLVSATLPEDRGKRVAAAALASVATLLNPYGLALHRFVLGYFLGTEGVYHAINAHIREFQSVVGAYGATVGPMDLVGWALVAGLALLALRSPAYRARAAFCLLLLAGALRQARHLELAGLLGAALLVPYLDELVGGARDRSEAWRRRFVIAVTAAATAVGLVAFAVERRTRTEREWIDNGTDFLAALDTVPDGARLYVPFPRAGLAIWYGWPRGIRVFFDPRNDCYSEETFVTFMSLGDPTTPPSRIASVFASTGTNAVLASASHRVVQWALRSPAFRATKGTGFFRAYSAGNNP